MSPDIMFSLPHNKAEPLRVDRVGSLMSRAMPCKPPAGRRWCSFQIGDCVQCSAINIRGRTTPGRQSSASRCSWLRWSRNSFYLRERKRPPYQVLLKLGRYNAVFCGYQVLARAFPSSEVGGESAPDILVGFSRGSVASQSCTRGSMSVRHSEWRVGLEATRTSCTFMRPHVIAMVLYAVSVSRATLPPKTEAT